MISFELSEEHRAVEQTVRDWAGREVAPKIHDLDREHRFERGFLKKTLVQNGWNRRRTAENLGIGYSTLKSKLKAYGIGSDDED